MTKVIKTPDQLSEALTEAIKESGLKKMFIADKFGITKQVMSRWCNGKLCNTTALNMMDLFDMLGMEIVIRDKEAEEC